MDRRQFNSFSLAVAATCIGSMSAPARALDLAGLSANDASAALKT